MAITERAVRLHRGRISAGNRADGGACILLLFPLVTSTLPAQEAPVEEGHPQTGDATPPL
ncbi:MAG: hypothetical protein ACP5E5_04230 [Acidobacteriaceae bacterium]